MNGMSICHLVDCTEFSSTVHVSLGLQNLIWGYTCKLNKPHKCTSTTGKGN
ncbi:hypothetical protein VIBNIAM115_790128 [Vibrio nigripulchritudo AM115]|nr:hypothetical protein VIBNIAM115_790128 [Vibrio nigripulchritudo AM115]